MINWAATTCWTIGSGERRRLLGGFVTLCERSSGSGGLSLYQYNRDSSDYEEQYVLPVTLYLTCEPGAAPVGGGGRRRRGRCEALCQGASSLPRRARRRAPTGLPPVLLTSPLCRTPLYPLCPST